MGLQTDVSPRPPRSSSLGGRSQLGGFRWPPPTEELQASGWTTGQSGIQPGSLCWLSVEQRSPGSLTFLCLSSPVPPFLPACLSLSLSGPGRLLPGGLSLLWVGLASLFPPVPLPCSLHSDPPPPLPLWVGSVGDAPSNLPCSSESRLLPPALHQHGLPGPAPTPAFWAFLWFVAFCFLANQWQVSEPKDNPLNEGTDAARAAIAFSFFSIFTWVSTPPSQPTPAHPSWAPGRGAFKHQPGSLHCFPPQCTWRGCSLRRETIALCQPGWSGVMADPGSGAGHPSCGNGFLS